MVQNIITKNTWFTTFPNSRQNNIYNIYKCLWNDFFAKWLYSVHFSHVRCPKMSTGQEKLAPAGWNRWHVFASDGSFSHFFCIQCTKENYLIYLVPIEYLHSRLWRRMFLNLDLLLQSKFMKCLQFQTGHKFHFWNLIGTFKQHTTYTYRDVYWHQQIGYKYGCSVKKADFGAKSNIEHLVKSNKVPGP